VVNEARSRVAQKIWEKIFPSKRLDGLLKDILAHMAPYIIPQALSCYGRVALNSPCHNLSNLQTYAEYILHALGSAAINANISSFILHRSEGQCPSGIKLSFQVELGKPNSTREYDLNSTQNYWEKHESDLNRTDFDPKSTRINRLPCKHVIL